MLPEEIDETIALGSVMHKESRYKRFDYAWNKLRQLGVSIITEPHLCCYIAEKDNKIVGVMILVCAEHYSATVKIVSDVLFYVHPDYRGSSAAVRLLKEAEKWGKIQGAAEINVGLSSGIDTEKTICFFKKIGYTQEAVQMSKEII
jgi:GNAT superfamily N-acetyltransferase